MAARTPELSAPELTMTRSTRIRKPSQKAKEIAEAIQPAKSPPSSSAKSSRAGRSATKPKITPKPKKRKSPVTVTAKVKAGGKKGRAVVDEDGDVQIEEVDAQHRVPTDEENDALYCICLGHDDHTPMIQCEECENWFHFACIQLDPSEASVIQAFYCDVCEASGSGKTQSEPEINEPLAENEEAETLLTEPTSSLVETPDREETTQDVELEPETDATLDASSPNTSMQVIQSNKLDTDASAPAPPPTGDPVPASLPSELYQETMAATHSPAPTKVSRKKHRRAEGLTSDEDDSDDDEDFTGEEVKRPSRKKRKVSIPALSLMCRILQGQEDVTYLPGNSLIKEAYFFRVFSSKTPAISDIRRLSHITMAPVTLSPQNPPTPPTPITGIDKTRTACIEQFLKLFEPAFSAKFEEQEGDIEAKKKQSESEAMRFAELVESELFESFGELDPKNVKAPRKHYMTKFRSLLFNLKHNPIFLKSLNTTETSPQSIVHMSNQDLQTPEQKAISEQIRQRALHDSVRNVISAPTAKMTHKGEQAIESFDPLKAQDAEISGPHRGNSISFHQPQTGGTEPSRGLKSSPRPTSDAGQFESSTPQSRPASSASLDNSQLPFISEAKPDPHHPGLAHDERSLSTSASETSASIETLNPFDLERVFAAMSSVPPPAATGFEKPHSPGLESGAKGPDEGRNDDGPPSSEDNMDLEATPEYEPEVDQNTESKAGHLPDDYDPFVVAHGGDADLDAILYGDQSTTPPHTPPAAPLQLVIEAPEAAPLPVPEPVSEAVAPKTDISVWKGNVMTADAGGFAASAVQVGGRPLCTSSSTWERLFPAETLTVVGRLPVKDSTSYLVQSHFASSRELIVLDLAPNLDGPPDLPSPDRVMQHQQNLIDFFTKKGRHAVVAVHDRAKHILRDIYLVPLLKQEAFPEFVELLDDVTIPESTPRPKDMLLAILVLQKGSIPTGWRPSPASASSVGASQPISAPVAPSVLLPLQPQLQFQAQAQPQPLSSFAPTFKPPPKTLPHLITTPLSYPLPPTSSALLPANLAASIPILKSLSSALSAAPQLPFNIFSHLPPPPAASPMTNTTPSTAIGPPPGFVPYVAPSSAASSVPTSVSSISPSANLVDLSHVDVNALQALLSNPQAFQPASDPAPRLVPHNLSQPFNNNTMAGSNRLNTYLTPSHKPPSAERSGHFPLTRSAGLPPMPQMTTPWPAQNESDHRNFNVRGAGPRISEPDVRSKGGGPRMQDTGWSPPYLQRGQNERGGWDSNGDRAQSRSAVAATAAAADAPYRRRSAGRGGGLSPSTGKRPGGPHEFVAPPQDGGWAGRGRGRMSGNHGNRSVSDHNHFQREEDQYSVPIWMGR